jgi:hypothetical protein
MRTIDGTRADRPARRDAGKEARAARRGDAMILAVIGVVAAAELALLLLWLCGGIGRG